MGAFAQMPSYPAQARQAFGFISGDVLRAAEKMPEEDYGFRATPDVRPFGELVAHAADTRIFRCSAVKREEKKGDAASKEDEGRAADRPESVVRLLRWRLWLAEGRKGRRAD